MKCFNHHDLVSDLAEPMQMLHRFLFFVAGKDVIALSLGQTILLQG